MRPAPFAYERVATAGELVAALADAGTTPTAVLAGGQSLIPRLNTRELRPERVVDIDAVAELDHLSVNGGVRIGALCRHAALERCADLDGPWAALRDAARHVALYPVRVRGTFGGSLANADPAAELALAAVTYDAEITARSAAGTRQIAARAFFGGPHRTALRPDEAIVEVRLPERGAGTVSAFMEVSRRAVGWPIASVCAVLEIVDGHVARAAIGLGAVGPTPLRAEEAEAALVGSALEAAAIDAAAAAAARECRDGDVETRRDLTEALVRRVLQRLSEGASR